MVKDLIFPLHETVYTYVANELRLLLCVPYNGGGWRETWGGRAQSRFGRAYDVINYKLSDRGARRIGSVGMVPLENREVDAFHHAQTLLHSESGMDCVRGLQGSISRRHRTKADHINLIQNDFAQQMVRLIKTTHSYAPAVGITICGSLDTSVVVGLSVHSRPIRCHNYISTVVLADLLERS